MVKRVLVAGATGYLGRFVVEKLKHSGYYVKVLVRSQGKLKQEGPFSSPAIHALVDEIVVGDVTEPDSLIGICSDVDYVFSSVGITRQKDSLTFMDVDYKGNLNLLREAEQSKVERFMYINVYGADHCPSALIKAKQKFACELKQSAIHPIIINPTGYYSDMTELLTMAEKGTVFLLGNGFSKINPIHGADLADYCVCSFSKEQTIHEVGGPAVYTYREIAEISLRIANQKRNKIITVPSWLVKCILPFLKLVNKRQYDLFQFFFYMMTHDVVAKPYGSFDLTSYFESVDV